MTGRPGHTADESTRPGHAADALARPHAPTGVCRSAFRVREYAGMDPLTVAGRPPTREPAGVSPERVAEVEGVIGRVTRWAAHRRDVVGLLLVGSYARSAARPDSDIDLVLLTTDQARYSGARWADGLALGDLIRIRSWGPIDERRFRTASGLEVEIGIGPPGWAGTDPVDPGTRRVITDGARALHDPDGALDGLIHACRP